VVTIGRNAERLFEDARKMISAQPCDHRQSCQGNFLADMSVYKFGDKLLLPDGQATAQRCRLQDIALPERMVSSIGKQVGAQPNDLIKLRTAGMYRSERQLRITRGVMSDTFCVSPIALVVRISCRTD
jgi:hypothetical protein